MEEKIETFYDNEGNYTGFAGTVELFKSKVYIDTRTGKGYDKAIVELQPYINHMASKYDFSILGYSFEDSIQHISMRIIEGIPYYKPHMQSKLSTFLYMRVGRRIINEIRNLGTDCKNPTILQTSLYSVTCNNCGEKFTITLGRGSSPRDYKCQVCNHNLKQAKVFSINAPPSSLSDTANETNQSYLDEISACSPNVQMVYGDGAKTEDFVISKLDLSKCIGEEEPSVRKLLELVCLNEHSIKSAAEIVGISHTGASNKLRQLGRKKKFRDMLGR